MSRRQSPPRGPGQGPDRDKIRSLERQLSEFQPGVLAVQEHPPSPAARRLLWLIAALFVTALLWSILGKVDIVAVAHGRIIPSGFSKPVQAPDSGQVSAIHVGEGQRVQRRDLLLELDATVSAAEVGRLEGEHRRALQSRERYRELLAMLEAGQHIESGTDGRASPASDRDTHDRLLQSQWVELDRRLQVLDEDMLRRRQTLLGAEAEVRKLERILPLADERAAGIKVLVDKRLQGRQAWFDVETERLILLHDLELQRIRGAEIAAGIRHLGSERSALLAESRRGFLEQLWASEQQTETLAQELVKARELLARRRIRAPVSGVVQQLSVHATGASVATGTTLLVIVPESGEIEIEATLLNRDVGFVHDGQSAVVKVETFPFTRYGTVPARVATVSRDAVADQQRGLVYSVRLELLQKAIRVNGRDSVLSPGMGVVAEISTGRRRIIDYLLSPLLRYRHEAMRER